MDRKRAKELLPVFEAFANGEDIEIKSHVPGVGWYPANDPVFNPNSEYRVKPKPREFWINLYRDDGHNFHVHNSKEKAEKFADSHLERTIKVREVL